MSCVAESSSISTIQDDDDRSLREDEGFLSAPKRHKTIRLSDESDSDANGTGQLKPESSSVQSRKYTLKQVPKSVVCKTEDDAIPLPDPFEVPKHYRADVEVDLKSGSMTEDTTRAFLSSVAASMFTYKRYPSADDYRNVARVIIQKYPFMKSPTGKPYVSLM